MIHFPKHACSLSLEHNGHKGYYETVEDYIKGIEDHDLDIDWSSETARARCIETNEVWELQWYPNTPIGFNLVMGPTLEEVLEKGKTYD